MTCVSRSRCFWVGLLILIVSNSVLVGCERSSKESAGEGAEKQQPGAQQEEVCQGKDPETCEVEQEGAAAVGNTPGSDNSGKAQSRESDSKYANVKLGDSVEENDSGSKKVWSTGQLMRQCMGQLDDINACNMLVQDYMKREKRKQEIKTQAEEAEKARKQAALERRFNSDTSQQPPPLDRPADTTHSQQNATPAPTSVKMEVKGGGILFLEDGTWWAYRPASPMREGKGTLTSPTIRGVVDVLHRHKDHGGNWIQIGSVLESEVPELEGEAIVRSPIVFFDWRTRKLILWALLSVGIPDEACVFGVAEATEVLGPFIWMDHFNLTKNFDDGTKCSDLQAIVEPEGEFFAMLLRTSPPNGPTLQSSRLLVLSNDLLQIRERLRFSGVIGTVLHVVNHGGFWHLFTINTNQTLVEDVKVNDVELTNVIWSARRLSSTTVWSSAGTPTQVKVYKKDGHPARSVSLMLNRQTGCALLLYSNGKLAARCGATDEMFPPPP